jgi:magnesium chelatase family protein
VSLAPADLPKESGRFDPPIALALLAATGQIPAAALAELEFAGELALSGELRPIRGALAMARRALEIAAAGSHGVLRLCPSKPDLCRQGFYAGSGISH